MRGDAKIRLCALHEAPCGASPGSDGPTRPVRLFPVQLQAHADPRSSSASLHNSTIRSTIYQLMLHSLDPLGKEGLP